jgi:uridine kinase
MTDNRSKIFAHLLEEVRKRKNNDRLFIIGISGIDTSGKTLFAESFQEFLVSQNLRTQLIKLDDFHNPKKIRYLGNDEVENYYLRGFNLDTILRELLEPARRYPDYRVRLKLLDLLTDKYETEKEYSFNNDTVVIFEGVFLFRNEFSPYIDYKIFLEISFEESKRRANERDVPVFGSQILSKYDTKYLPAQQKYLDDFPLKNTTDIIIDNIDWNNPKISWEKEEK